MAWLAISFGWHVMPVRWEREQAERSVGVRTLPPAAMASCGHVLADTLSGHDAAAPSRIMLNRKDRSESQSRPDIP